jgi:hypothetical protein
MIKKQSLFKTAFFVICTVLLLVNILHSMPYAASEQQKKSKLPKELEAFVLKGYLVLDYKYGDLNRDRDEDVILILKKENEKQTSDVVDHPEKRPLFILIRQADNSLKSMARNDNVVYCVDCGGVMGDPYMGIAIKKGYFSVEHYGGSSWRWTRIITFKYSRKENNWFLHKDGAESFHASTPDKVKATIKTFKDFGRIPFLKFDIYREK